MIKQTNIIKKKSTKLIRDNLNKMSINFAHHLMYARNMMRCRCYNNNTQVIGIELIKPALKSFKIYHIQQNNLQFDDA